jgi:protease-4
MIGIKALAAGLVHGLGGIDDAIAVAKQLADIGENTDVDLQVLGSGHSLTLPTPGSKMLYQLSDWTEYIYDLSRPQLWAVEPARFEPALLAIE